MTNKEMVLYLIKKMDKIYCEHPKYIELGKWMVYYGYYNNRENINFKFDKNDNIIDNSTK